MTQPTGSENNTFFSQILEPGSSLHPTFLLIADLAFLSLLVVFIILIFLTRSLHVLALILIELGLWASVKWFVSEMKKIPVEEKQDTRESENETRKTS